MNSKKNPKLRSRLHQSIHQLIDKLIESFPDYTYAYFQLIGLWKTEAKEAIKKKQDSKADEIYKSGLQFLDNIDHKLHKNISISSMYKELLESYNNNLLKFEDAAINKRLIKTLKQYIALNFETYKKLFKTEKAYCTGYTDSDYQTLAKLYLVEHMPEAAMEVIREWFKRVKTAEKYYTYCTFDFDNLLTNKDFKPLHAQISQYLKEQA